ncbi:hypothetical protein OTV31_003427 [Salmonella enterica]|nr:hypothetical protein [Salmonella enterica]EKE2066519.1 hypothetical protein [Salmonella enterica]EKM6810480.1 hypothetical protein [Salmonella enterica]
MPRNESAQITTGNDRTQVTEDSANEVSRLTPETGRRHQPGNVQQRPADSDAVDKLTDVKAILDYQPDWP